MGTRSNIGLEEPDGTILYVYCHYDGYLEHNGAMLVKHYSDEKKIRELLNLGDLRCLDTTLAESVFFGRDKGEQGAQRVYVNSRGAMTSQEFSYLWSVRGQAWFVYRGGPIWPRLDSMIPVIETLKDPSFK